MRYIRTKDGKIIDIGKYKIVKRMCDGVYYRNSDKEIWRVIYTEDKKAEADTIEKLCDCFVVIRPQQKGNDYYTFHSFAFIKEKCLNGNEIVYGAIWTKKGLIYVAQMNSKGELELL